MPFGMTTLHRPEENFFFGCDEHPANFVSFGLVSFRALRHILYRVFMKAT
jgi:hypothetical protein